MAKLCLEKVNTSLLDWITNIAEENRCVIEETQWQSKYNAYVTYEYEPFCSDGFNLNITIRGNKNFLNFVDYLCKKHFENIKHLENCLGEINEDKEEHLENQLTQVQEASFVEPRTYDHLLQEALSQWRHIYFAKKWGYQ